MLLTSEALFQSTYLHIFLFIQHLLQKISSDDPHYFLWFLNLLIMYYKKDIYAFNRVVKSWGQVFPVLYIQGAEKRKIKEENEAPESDIDGSTGVGSSRNR